MNREQAKAFLPIIKAFSEGKIIEVKQNEGYWSQEDDLTFYYPPNKYRIRPSFDMPILCEKCAFDVNGLYCGLKGYTHNYPRMYCSAYSVNAPYNFKLSKDGYFEWLSDKESKFSPFTNAKECIDEMKKHHPFGLLKCPGTKYGMISEITDNGICFSNKESLSFKELFDDYWFADDEPLGIKRE